MFSPKQGFQGWGGERDWDVQIPRTSELRLSLTSGTPVTTGDVTGAGALYLTAHEGNLISLPWKNGKTGSKWNVFEVPKTPSGVHEISASFLANSAWALASGSNYDVFAKLGSSGPVLLRGPAWTSDTVRAAALTRDDTGRRVLSTDWSQFYLGSLRASGTNTVDDSEGLIDAGAKRFLWNAFNRVLRPVRCLDGTDSWTYSTATWRQARAAATNQIEVLSGLSVQDSGAMISLSGQVLAQHSAIGNYGSIGIGVDNTTTPSNAHGNVIGAWQAATNGANTLVACTFLMAATAIGYHYYAWLERGNGTVTATWLSSDGGASPVSRVSGLVGWWES